MQLHPAPLAMHLQRSFALHAGNAEITPAFHGTAAANHASIFGQGLCIPGRGNSLRVVHGTAHGQGVYTACLGNVRTSIQFCSERRMLVCGVLDNLPGWDQKASPLPVKHVSNNVMVVSDPRRVTPLFEATAVGVPATTQEEVEQGTWISRPKPRALVAATPSLRRPPGPRSRPAGAAKWAVVGSKGAKVVAAYLMRCAALKRRPRALRALRAKGWTP